MAFYYLKAAHIIFVVTWFAGLFYIVRLFIYHVEANDRPDPDKKILQEQFLIMQRRLWYGITWPSCVLAIIFGTSLIHDFLPLSENPWLLAKLLLVLLLFIYHLSCGHIYLQLKKGIIKFSSNQLRLWNEVATVFLIGIVCLVELQEIMALWHGLIALTIFSFFLVGAIKMYKIRRTQALKK